VIGKRLELTALRADGAEFPIELTVTQFEMDGRPAFTAFIRDITERKRAATERERAEDALRASEHRFRTLARQAPVGIIALDMKARCTFVNERWCEMAGMEPDQACDQGWQDAIHPSDREALLAAFFEAVRDGKEVAAQFRMRTHEGAETWVQGAASPLRNCAGDVTGYLGTVTDISARIDSERTARFLADATSELNASLDYEQALGAVAKLAVPALADCCAIHIVDDGLVRLVALSHVDPKMAVLIDELEGASRTVSSDDPRTVRAMRSEVVTDVTEDVLPAVVLTPAHGAVWRAMLVRSYVVAPLIVRGTVLGSIHLMMGEAGRRFTEADRVLAEDLARRAAFAVENARLYRETQEAVVAREEFLSIASHELRTPLTTLQLAVQHLSTLASTSPDGSWAFALQKVGRATKRLTAMAEDLLEVTGGDRSPSSRGDFDDVDLAALTRDVVSEMQDDIARSGSKVYVRSSGGAVGHWDRRRIEQVVVNLLSNAFKFGSKRSIVIAIDSDDVRVRLRIRDHGIGIAPHDLEHVFERFGRAVSDRHYGGFGLGLWLVRQIVEAHGGSISVKSRVGRGSTFTVELPRSVREATTYDARSSAAVH
jgi:PAS domain S-box-containing protein